MVPRQDLHADKAVELISGFANAVAATGELPLIRLRQLPGPLPSRFTRLAGLNAP
jgi:hypothetical protein